MPKCTYRCRPKSRSVRKGLLRLVSCVMSRKRDWTGIPRLVGRLGFRSTGQSVPVIGVLCAYIRCLYAVPGIEWVVCTVGFSVCELNVYY